MLFAGAGVEACYKENPKRWILLKFTLEIFYCIYNIKLKNTIF